MTNCTFKNISTRMGLLAVLKQGNIIWKWKEMTNCTVKNNTFICLAEALVYTFLPHVISSSSTLVIKRVSREPLRQLYAKYFCIIQWVTLAYIKLILGHKMSKIECGFKSTTFFTFRGCIICGLIGYPEVCTSKSIIFTNH